MMNTATIRDVAKQAGVSVATVSRFINGSGVLSADTQRRVQAAVEELQYRPNTLARALSKRAMHVIGLIVPTIRNFFFPELFQEVSQHAMRRGYNVVLCKAEDEREERSYIDMLRESMSYGVITTTGRCSKDYQSASRLRVVSLDRALPGIDCFVMSNNTHGGYLAADHLYRRGCHRLCFVGLAENSISQQSRLAGFRAVCQRYDLESTVIMLGNERVELSERDERRLATCDGVFAWSDYTALQLYGILNDLGRRIPEDVQLVGFDNTYVGRMFIPSITSISQDIQQLAASAVDLLLDPNQEKGRAVTKVIDVQLVQGQTTLSEPCS